MPGCNPPDAPAPCAWFDATVRRLTLLLVAAALTAAGCGSPAADLFVVTRSGPIPGARLKLLASDDGSVRCNGGARRDMGSDRLLDARELARDLAPEAERDRRLPPRPGSVLRYSVRLEDGTVSFADNSAAVSSQDLRLAAFTRDVARAVCGLAR
jgi:hypothetical protein